MVSGVSIGLYDQGGVASNTKLASNHSSPLTAPRVPGPCSTFPPESSLCQWHEI